MLLSEWIEKKNGRGRAMSRSKLAALIDVSESSLCRYLNGTRRPTVAVAARIIEVTHGEVRLADLVESPGSRA